MPFEANYLNDFFHADFPLELPRRREQLLRLNVLDKVGGRVHQRHDLAGKYSFIIMRDILLKSESEQAFFRGWELKIDRVKGVSHGKMRCGNALSRVGTLRVPSV